MASGRKVAYANTVSPSTAAEHLESLARGLRERAMLVESGASSVTLDVPGDVQIKIDVFADAAKGGIEIGMGWRKREAGLSDAPGLLIVPGAAAFASHLDDV